jgi:AcrR family transcriptional regulator
MDRTASIETAWGLRGQPRKGPRPGLSQSKIVEAAVRVADREGLDAVSMAKVAAELGTAPMSLYRHVASKEELVELMVDAAWGPPPDPPPSGTWRERLAAWAWGTRAAMYRHPWALRVPISGLPAYPNSVAWFEQGLAALEGTALPEARKASVLLLMGGYVRNEATTNTQIAAAVGDHAAAKGLAFKDAGNDWMRLYRDIIAKVTDPIRFPATTRLLQSGVFDVADGPDDEFIFGLERLLDGVERLVHARE